MIIGIVLVVVGIVLTNIGGSMTKKFIKANNPHDKALKIDAQKTGTWDRLKCCFALAPLRLASLSSRPAPLARRSSCRKNRFDC